MTNTPTLLVIVGPTAVGKSSLAIRLAQFFNTSILSADSRQCFKEMSIGTAKPSLEEQALVPHYFVDSHSIHDIISAGSYERLALSCLKQLFEQNSVVVVCGGTGLYINALLYGMDSMPPVEESYLARVIDEYESKGVDWIKNELKLVDGTYAAQGDLENPARMQRALAFFRQHGASIIAYQKGKKKKRPFNVIGIGLELPRPELYERINMRVDTMLEEGLLDEVKELQPYSHLKNLKTVGYQEFYKKGLLVSTKEDLDFAIGKVKQHTRNYAKRQLTWFKNKGDYQWFSPNDFDEILAFILKKREETRFM